MLKLSEIKTALETATGIPVAYHHFEDSHAYPYIVFEITDSNNFIADNIVFWESDEIQIDLYTTTKNQALTRKVINTLNALELVWEKRETAVQTENCYAVSFYTTAHIEDDITD